jgi:hypothetical protein
MNAIINLDVFKDVGGKNADGLDVGDETRRKNDVVYTTFSEEIGSTGVERGAKGFLFTRAILAPLLSIKPSLLELMACKYYNVVYRAFYTDFIAMAYGMQVKYAPVDILNILQRPAHYFTESLDVDFVFENIEKLGDSTQTFRVSTQPSPIYVVPNTDDGLFQIGVFNSLDPNVTYKNWLATTLPMSKTYKVNPPKFNETEYQLKIKDWKLVEWLRKHYETFIRTVLKNPQNLPPIMKDQRVIDIDKEDYASNPIVALILEPVVIFKMKSETPFLKSTSIVLCLNQRETSKYGCNILWKCISHYTKDAATKYNTVITKVVDFYTQTTPYLLGDKKK